MEAKHIIHSAFWIATLVFMGLEATAAPSGGEGAGIETWTPEKRVDPGKEPAARGGCFDGKCKRGGAYAQQAKVPQSHPQKPKLPMRTSRGEKKPEMLTFKGWSASGMPFNVLYIPNGFHHKVLSSLNYASASRLVPAPKPREPEVRREYLPVKKQQKKPLEKLDLRSPNLRKHILVIPHLFVSYGWGPIGK